MNDRGKAKRTTIALETAALTRLCPSGAQATGGARPRRETARRTPGGPGGAAGANSAGGAGGTRIKVATATSTGTDSGAGAIIAGESRTVWQQTMAAQFDIGAFAGFDVAPA